MRSSKLRGFGHELVEVAAMHFLNSTYCSKNRWSRDMCARFVQELVEVAHTNLMFCRPKTRQTPLNIYFKADTSQMASLLYW